nr:SRPBCC domain-containing protein [Rhodococcus sp. BL-253-APC-6A1W]
MPTVSIERPAGGTSVDVGGHTYSVLTAAGSDDFFPARRSYPTTASDPPRQEGTVPDSFDVVSTRTFSAPAEEVWRAWQDPEHVKRWWGPHGFTVPVADLDFRVGGTSLVGMRAPAEYGGQDMFNTWTYRRIEPTSLLEFDLAFTDASGTRVASPPGVPEDVRHVITFVPGSDGRTMLTVTEFGYADEQARDLSKAGLEQCLDKMTDLLTS